MNRCSQGRNSKQFSFSQISYGVNPFFEVQLIYLFSTHPSIKGHSDMTENQRIHIDLLTAPNTKRKFTSSAMAYQSWNNTATIVEKFPHQKIQLAHLYSVAKVAGAWCHHTARKLYQWRWCFGFHQLCPLAMFPEPEPSLQRWHVRKHSWWVSGGVKLIMLQGTDKLICHLCRTTCIEKVRQLTSVSFYRFWKICQMCDMSLK